MISETYGRVIRRYEGASPVPLDEQFTAGKVEAMTLLSAMQTTPPAQQGGAHRWAYGTKTAASEEAQSGRLAGLSAR